MFKNVSVLVPTRGRVARLRTLLESFKRTQVSGGSQLVFRIDSDDYETLEFFHEHEHTVIVGDREEGYRSMPSFFNELAEFAVGDVLMCGNDDMVFQTVGWDTLLLEEANKYPDGVFNLGVTTMNETHFPFSTVSRRVVERLGFIWDPRIFWGDIYLRDVMAFFGRCVMVPKVFIAHDWAGLNPDQVFLETRPSKALIEHSSGYWPNIHNPAVTEAIEKLRSLLE